MTKFNPEGKEELTFGECLHPAMDIVDQEDADQYLAEYTKFIQKYLDVEPNPKGYNATQIARINLGYFAGYFSKKTQERVNRLFKTDGNGLIRAILDKGD